MSPSWQRRTYSVSRSIRARCRRRLRRYVPIPKSWSLRASIATRIEEILSLPARPFEPVVVAHLPQRAGEHAALPGGFAGCHHLGANLACGLAHIGEPPFAVVRRVAGEANLARLEYHEPRTVARARRVLDAAP